MTISPTFNKSSNTKDISNTRDYTIKKVIPDYCSKEWSETEQQRFQNRFLNVGLILDTGSKDTDIFYAPVGLLPYLVEIGFSKKEIIGVYSFLGIVRHIIKYKSAVRKKPDSFANIHNFAIRNIITDHKITATPLISRLVAGGLIEVDPHYQVAVRSTGYRLTEKAHNLKWEKRNFGEFINSLSDEYVLKTTKKLNLWARACTYFTDWRTMEEGKIKNACKKTEEIIQRCKIVLTDELGKELDFAAYVKSEAYKQEKTKKNQPILWEKEDVLECYMNGLEDLNAGRARVSIDQRTGRKYSVVTNLKRELRKAIQLDGVPLISLDIKSMQVCLLADFYNESAEDKKEKEKFIDILTNQDIYTLLADGKMSRDQAKLDTFTILFAKTFQHKGQFWDNFSALFPILAKTITNLKLNHNYRFISRMCQTKEAKIVIEGAESHLLNDLNIDCLTCHDSIMCLPEDAELVEKTMIRFFLAEMGFAPVIKKE